MQSGRKRRESLCFQAALLLSLSACLAFAQYSGPWSNGWKYGYLPGGNITALAEESASGSVVYAASAAGIWKTTNSGASWAFLPNSPPLARMLVWDTGAATLYAANDYFVWKTTNHGSAWTRVFTAPPANTGYGTTLHLSGLVANSGTVYVSFQYSNVGSGPLFVSHNSGASWNNIVPVLSDGSGGYFNAYGILNMQMDPFQSGILYISAAPKYVTISGVQEWFCMMVVAPCEIYASYGGATNAWSRVGYIFEAGSGVHETIYPERDAQGVLYAYVGTDIFQYVCSGGLCQWSLDANGPDGAVANMVVDGCTGYQMVVALADGGVGVNSFTGTGPWTYTDRSNGLGNDQSPNTVGPMALRCSGGVYAGMQGGIWVTTDTAQSWKEMDTGLNAATVNALVVSPDVTHTIFAGTDADGIFRSFDGGATWTAANTGLVSSSPGGTLNAISVESIAVEPANPLVVLAATTGGMFRSTDGGTSWTRHPWFDTFPYYPQAAAVAADPITPGVFYALASRGVILAKSTDSGQTWTAGSLSSNPNYYGGQHGFVLSPRTYPMFEAAPGGVAVLASSSASWKTTLVADVHAVNVDPSFPNVVYAGGTGLWKSMDFGTTWKHLPFAQMGTIEDIAVSRDSTVYVAINAGTSTNSVAMYPQGIGGVWCSRDGGKTWQNLNLHGWVDANALAVDRRTGNLFVGTSGLGLGILPVPTTPVLQVSPSSLTFAAGVGGPDPHEKPITMTNLGVGTMSWTMATDAPWLNIRQTAGTVAPGASSSIPVEVDTTGMRAGTYSCVIRVTAQGATGSPTRIPVTLVVRATTPGPITPVR